MTEPLKDHQIAALRKLRDDPSALVEAGVLGMLRRRGLVGRETAVVTDPSGRKRQKTVSPITPMGRIALGEKVVVERVEGRSS